MRPRLRRELGARDVFAISTGTTLASGFFLLPGLAAEQAGPALVLAYLLAAVPLLPAMLSILELATALPRAGGTYYFLDRSLGPLAGTIGGFGTLLALVLKSAFALIGMGAYLRLFVPELPLAPLAAGVALVLGLLSLLGSRASGRFQVALVAILLGILAVFFGGSLPVVELSRLRGALGVDARAILSTAGLVYVSYIGLTGVVSLSEEVHDPERNLPLGVLVSLATTVVIYVVGTWVMVGVLGAEDLAGDMTAAASVAFKAMGPVAGWTVTGAALLASVSVANAGIMAASRYPLAMSRDHLFPRAFIQIGPRGVPTRAVLATVGWIVAIVLFLDPLEIAEIAGAFQLLVFALLNLAVVVMRESRIESYDPGFRSPLYPWMQIFGMLAPLVLIAGMGIGAVIFTLAVVAGASAWYFSYAHAHVARGGAILHVFERLGRGRFAGLEVELRGILKEKGLRRGDRFEEVVARAQILDLEAPLEFEALVRRAASALADSLGCSADLLARGFLEGTRIGATPVEHGVAIPHLRVPGIEAPELVVVRSRLGLRIDAGTPYGEPRSSDAIRAVFFLVSPEGDASQHLRFLAQLAVRVEEEEFMRSWLAAADAHGLRDALLHSDRSLSIVLRRGAPSEAWVDRPVSALDLPDGCLLAVVYRGDEGFVPGAETLLYEGDRVLAIGDTAAIDRLRERFEAS
ncbi:MAG: amino acid permease [Myxococcota bacterium]